MKAAVYLDKNVLKIMELEDPKPSSNEVVVKVKATGICTTDLKILSGFSPHYKGPFILGHEVAGVVHEVGENVSEVSVGMNVTIYPIAACGMCYFCREGLTNLCEYEVGFGHGIDGSFAEYVKVPERIVKLGGIVEIGDVSYEEGSITEPLSCAINSIEKCNLKPKNWVLIVGCGPMGLLNMMTAKYFKAKTIVTDFVEHRLDYARRLGADRTVNPKKENLESVVNGITSGRGVDSIIIATGDPRAIKENMRFIRKGGVINIFGGPPLGSIIAVTPRWIHYSEITLTGSFASTISQFKRAVRIIRENEINVKPIITHKFKLNEIFNAVDLALKKEMLKGCIIF